MFQGWLFNGTRMLFVTDAVFWLLSPLWIRETYRAVMGSKARFKVTDKAVHRDRGVVHWRLLPFHALVLLLLLAGLAYTLFDSNAPAHHQGPFQANTWMSVYFVLVILAGVAPVAEPPKRRQADRYQTDEHFEVQLPEGRACWPARDLSLGGVRLAPGAQQAAPMTLDIEIPGIGQLAARRVRVARDRSVAYAFEGVPADQRTALIRRLYCTEQYIRMPRQWGLGGTVGGFARQLFT